jgi:hypothetical protein
MGIQDRDYMRGKADEDESVEGLDERAAAVVSYLFAVVERDRVRFRPALSSKRPAENPPAVSTPLPTAAQY